jgi:hypothetical protein
MPEHHINDSESLLLPIPDESLMRTPSVTDSTGGAISENQARERGRMVKTADQVVQLAFENGLKVSEAITVSLLPTSTLGHIRNYDEPIDDYLQRRQDYVDGNTKGMPGVSLGVAVRMEMLPTPVASEGYKAPSQQTSETKSKTGQVWLSNVAKDIELMGTPRANAATATPRQIESGAPKARIEDQVLTQNWGRFEPAIRRWEEVIGRPAPAPTNPDGKDGNHRLSSKFTEWMMGLPDGWITDVGLTRNEELKACGNGVVPQQAKLALTQLLKGITL